MNKQHYFPAPPLEVDTWLNTDKFINLSDLKGKVVVIYAFQMLCPGCVSHGIPQANKIYELYYHKDVDVIGLHTVFEHHDVMTKNALEVFIHEYRIPFPIAIDKPSSVGPIPQTMKKYNMQGTPTIIFIDKVGKMRLNFFGQMDDMQVGNIIGQLLEANEDLTEKQNIKPAQKKGEDKCNDDVCFK